MRTSCHVLNVQNWRTTVAQLVCATVAAVLPSVAIAGEVIGQLRCQRPGPVGSCARVLRSGKPVAGAVSFMAVESGDLVEPVAGGQPLLRYQRLACPERLLTQPETVKDCQPPPVGWVSGRVRLDRAKGTTTRGESSEIWQDPQVPWPPDNTEWLEQTPRRVFIPSGWLAAGAELVVVGDVSKEKVRKVAVGGWNELPMPLRPGQQVAWSVEAGGKGLIEARRLRLVDPDRARQLAAAVAEASAQLGDQIEATVLAWLVPSLHGETADLADVALDRVRSLAQAADPQRLALLRQLAVEVVGPTQQQSMRGMEATVEDASGRTLRFAWRDMLAGQAITEPLPKDTKLTFRLHGIEPTWAVGVSFVVQGKPEDLGQGQFVELTPTQGLRYAVARSGWMTDNHELELCWLLGTPLRAPVVATQTAASLGQVRGCVRIR